MQLHAHAADDTGAFAEIDPLAWPAGWASGTQTSRALVRASRTSSFTLV